MKKLIAAAFLLLFAALFSCSEDESKSPNLYVTVTDDATGDKIEGAEVEVYYFIRQVETPDFDLINYPNPFTTNTGVDLQLQTAGELVLELFSDGKLDREIYTGELSAGNHSFQISGPDEDGFYFLKASFGGDVKEVEILKIERNFFRAEDDRPAEPLFVKQTDASGYCVVDYGDFPYLGKKFHNTAANGQMLGYYEVVYEIAIEVKADGYDNYETRVPIEITEPVEFKVKMLKN